MDGDVERAALLCEVARMSCAGHLCAVGSGQACAAGKCLEGLRCCGVLGCAVGSWYSLQRQCRELGVV